MKFSDKKKLVKNTKSFLADFYASAKKNGVMFYPFTIFVQIGERSSMPILISNYTISGARCYIAGKEKFIRLWK